MSEFSREASNPVTRVCLKRHVSNLATSSVVFSTLVSTWERWVPVRETWIAESGRLSGVPTMAGMETSEPRSIKARRSVLRKRRFSLKSCSKRRVPMWMSSCS
jgi:hypothetical protein